MGRAPRAPCHAKHVLLERTSKSTEAIAFEHLVPLRILFPTDNQGAAAHPYRSRGLEKQCKSEPSACGSKIELHSGHAHTSQVPTNWWGWENASVDSGNQAGARVYRKRNDRTKDSFSEA